MKLIKKVNALILGLAVLLASGCDKDKPETQVIPELTNNLNLPECVATSWQGVGHISKAYSGQYEYDNLKRIVKVKYFMDNHWTFQFNIHYNAAGAIREIIGNNGATNDTIERIIYDYNPAGQLIKRTYYDTNLVGQFNLTSWSTYEYNAGNKLIKTNYYDPADPNAAASYSIISYPGPNQVTMEIYHILNGTPLLGHRFENTYDNQKKPQIFVGVRPTDNFDLLSDHNLLIEKHTTFAGFNPTTDIRNYSYLYNENSYPTEKSLSWNGDAPALAEIFTYTCQ